MMLIFATFSLTSAFQWIEFVIVPGVFQEFFGVSLNALNWTSMIYMAAFIPLVFPATWLIDNTGLKNICLIGSGKGDFLFLSLVFSRMRLFSKLKLPRCRKGFAFELF